jgi:hypothetical protein
MVFRYFVDNQIIDRQIFCIEIEDIKMQTSPINLSNPGLSLITNLILMSAVGGRAGSEIYEKFFFLMSTF